MNQPSALIEFIKLTHAFHIAHTMANYGMNNTGKDLSEMDGMNPDGLFQVGTKDT